MSPESGYRFRDQDMHEDRMSPESGYRFRDQDMHEDRMSPESGNRFCVGRCARKKRWSISAIRRKRKCSSHLHLTRVAKKGVSALLTGGLARPAGSVRARNFRCRASRRFAGRAADWFLTMGNNTATMNELLLDNRTFGSLQDVERDPGPCRSARTSFALRLSAGFSRVDAMTQTCVCPTRLRSCRTRRVP